MEKVRYKNSRNLTLVGHLHQADSSKMIIMVHGFTSDKSSRGRFDRLTATIQEKGYGVLAFDSSGSGESDDDSINVAKRIDDLNATVSYVKQLGYKDISFYGHSLGARVCLEAYNDSISTMVLTGAGTGPVFYNWEDMFSEEQLKELKETGNLTYFRPTDPLREKMVIEKQMLLDFEEFDQEKLLKRVDCPVLIIHGNEGWEEPQLSKVSFQGKKWMSEESEIKVIDGADHSFEEHLLQVEALALDWFDHYFPM